MRSEIQTTPALAKPHGYITRAFHWLTGGMLLYGYATGVEDLSQLADPAFFRNEIIFAVALGGAFAVRLLWNKWTGAIGRKAPNAGALEGKIAAIVHYGIYAGVFAIVLSGLGIALGYAVPVLGGFFLSAMIGLHEVSLSLTAVLLIGHVAAALFHKFIRRDGVLESMTGSLPV